MLNRVKQHFSVETLFKDNAYVLNTLNGKRYYQLIRKVQSSDSRRWFVVPGLMFLFASLAVFISPSWEINRRWQLPLIS
ncbi:MAG: hypothetical protein HRU25_05190 [Psychrobium sp.]|nr:hypothetical protein [Psychrobium sp.]